MQKKTFKNNFKNYWRNIDKSILTGFFLLFFLGIFFSFASTSFLAGERLDKDYYFFFSKHFVFAFYFNFFDDFYFICKITHSKRFVCSHIYFSSNFINISSTNRS